MNANGTRLPSTFVLEPEPYATQPPEHGRDESPAVVFQRIHRLLRGRYWIALILAGIGAAAGAIGGFMSSEPKYQSVGSLRILSNVGFKIYGEPNNQTYMDLNAIVKTHANLLQDPRVIDKAFRSNDWRKLNRPDNDTERERFRKSLNVTTDREEPGWIRVKFLDESPVAAQTAVREVIAAYVEIYGGEEMIITPKLIADVKSIVDKHERDVDVLEKEIQAISLKYNTPQLSELAKSRLDEFNELNKQIFFLESQIRAGEMQAGAEAAGGPEVKQDIVVMAGELAKTDVGIARLLDAHLTAEANLLSLKAQGVKDTHPELRKRTQLASAAKQGLETAVNNFIGQRGGVGLAPGMGNFKIGPAALQTFKQSLAQLKDDKTRKDTEMEALTKDSIALADLQEELASQKLERDAAKKRYVILTTESDSSETSSSRIKIVNDGEMPLSPYSDPRKKLAAMGIFFGGGIPIALVMLLGLIDGRYRYSDEATGPNRHVTLLGILPYLPSHMHDPEQAAVAAHCVHQIRTLLQIGGQMHDRRVFTITSPTAGDGKTSLSLSLGLSFAAAGSNTCLIDFDMIGGGLTSGMQAKTESGLMDAIDAGSIDGFVRPTSFPRLSILPIGRDDARDVSRLSPRSVREIVQQAKKRFDIVVIDTGPILGSIEASLACAAADGVILALGRGQQRHHADKAIEHLHNLGAHLLGIVFNRAQAADFKRSVSSASVRSIPALERGPAGGNGHASRLRALPDMGPMATTVASGIRDDDRKPTEETPAE
jgi:polysaccharide biosynthesis transport protein